MDQNEIRFPVKASGVFPVDLPIMSRHGGSKFDLITLEAVVHGLGNFKKVRVAEDHLP